MTATATTNKRAARSGAPLRRMLTALVLALCCTGSAAAQDSARSMEEPYKFDMGLAMGMSGYWGDLSSNMFAHPGIAATLLFHYRFDTRWLIRASFTGMTISGSNTREANMLPGGEYSFSGGCYSLDARGEFNFFNFGIGETYKRLRRWTPYLGLGLGGALSTGNGSTAFALELPMAVGAKYKVNERLNVGLEWTFTKVFGDKVEGYGSLTGINTDFIRHTDWTTQLQIYFTLEFGRRCTVCNRQD